MVELHRLPGSSRYGNFDIQTETCFSVTQANNGTFTIANGELYFIETWGTATGTLNVLIASKMRGYKEQWYQASTVFLAQDVSDGILTIHGGDLYYIKTRNTESGVVE